MLLNLVMNTNNNKFFNENERNDLMNDILNTDYDDEDEVWDFALKLEHISIVLRRNVLEHDDGKNESDK